MRNLRGHSKQTPKWSGRNCAL